MKNNHALLKRTAKVVGGIREATKERIISQKKRMRCAKNFAVL
jgi:hypothetical protein